MEGVLAAASHVEKPAGSDHHQRRTAAGGEAKYRANILSEAHRMAQLVQELLSLSVWRPLPVRSCRQSWTPRPFLGSLRDMAAGGGKAGDRLTLRLPDGALPPIRADEDALKQVMAILLSNAVQHTPAVRRSNFRRGGRANGLPVGGRYGAGHCG